MTGPQPMTVRREKVIALAAQGVWASEIARQVDMTPSGVISLLCRFGLSAGKKPKVVRPRKERKVRAPDPEKQARDEEMASMYRQGLTLARIGEHFKVSRERVRQILRRMAVPVDDGGQRKQASHKTASALARRNLRTQAKWGLDYDEMKKRRADGTLVAFVRQRNSAKLRGISWRLSFGQWLDVWMQSGKLAQRGRGKGKYVMSRIKDEGGYVFGNVHIQLSTENNRQGIAKCRFNHAVMPGVLLLYPGSSKPYQAYFGHDKLGCFATADEAAAVRAAYIESTGKRPRAVTWGAKAPQAAQPSQGR